MDNWRGVQVVLYPARVDFQGKRVPAIRVDYAEVDGKSAPPPAKEEVADDVPF
jgi:hypothetical protein